MRSLIAAAIVLVALDSGNRIVTAQSAEGVTRRWSCLAGSAAEGRLFGSVVTEPTCAGSVRRASASGLQSSADGLSVPREPPERPTALTATVVERSIILSWTPGGDSVSSYVLEAGSKSGLSDLSNADTGSALPKITVANVPPGSYYIRVRTRRPTGTSDSSNEAVVTVKSDCVAAPGAPSNLAKTLNAAELTLIWKPPITGCAPTSYVIEVGSAPGLGDVSSFSTGSALTRFSASALAEGRYYARVRSANAGILSAASNELDVSVRASSLQGLPITGPDVPEIANYDEKLVALLREWNIPGASIAVTKNGKLILARGYGWADRERRISVQPGSLFRIGSLVKSFTAAAVLHLVDEGRLNLDSKFLDILPRYQLPPTADRRLRDITIRQLLQHSGGWDRHASGDPMIDPELVSKAVSAPQGRGCDAIIASMMARPLDFPPGSQFAYSNFGYCILGRVIEQITGQSYDEYLKATVLRPMGIDDMEIGRTRSEDQSAGEVKYYDYPGAPLTASILGAPTAVPAPYGGFFLEAMDSHGAWIASAVDLLRFVTALDGKRGPAFLSQARIADMTQRPKLPSNGDASWYGMGWYVDVHGTWWHTGSLPGASSEFARTADGYAWAILVNTRPLKGEAFFDALDKVMWDALNETPKGSPTDLFPLFPSSHQ